MLPHWAHCALSHRDRNVLHSLFSSELKQLKTYPDGPPGIDLLYRAQGQRGQLKDD